jgi:gamma-glutamyltranspeptidase / glutathione hydrolase
MPRQIIANSAAVATGHPQGASAGLEVLQDGGNAVDAAVAAMLALSVVIPGSVGLGGYGGSAVIRLADKHPRAGGNGCGACAVDFDSRAPLKFRPGSVTADPQSCLYGARSVSVPAVVAGLDLILREFGTKSWRAVSQPAIRLAEEGFEVDSEHRRYLDRCAPQFDKPSLANLFPGGTVPEIGDHWRQPDLARLLHRLSNEGPAAFYDGEIPRAIVRYLRDRGGILTDDDFRTYRPEIVDPVHASCRRFELYTPPPPSGGITSLGILQTVEGFGMQDIEPWGGLYFHRLGEATKLCWQQRDRYFGDPEFVSIPIAQLLSDEAVASRIEEIRSGRISRGPESAPDSPHTSNVIAIDAAGNLISLTATQGWMYGSHLVVDGMGLVLNHGMSRFTFSPGHPNAPAAGKRMQHNMSPMIVLETETGHPAFAFGLPGGPKIVNVTAQLALDLIALGATPAESIAAPRLHAECDEPLLVSAHTPPSVIDELMDLGHDVRCEEDMGGPVNVLAIDPQTRQIDVASGETTGDVAGF